MPRGFLSVQQLALIPRYWCDGGAVADAVRGRALLAESASIRDLR